MSFLKAASNNPYPRQNNNRKVWGVALHKKGIVSVPILSYYPLQMKYRQRPMLKELSRA
eukprot:CAMPEP_0201142664 /NCGR_PEP_ID=MMETSP0851-20130426/4337_1 /ASSEMBLY_ACC=CAM_ASM_000631 /TAXON_ID=183588 /ORGANISM="Pseudo-nitzschia fraudulenta, Strain WWA7" /LENGTH=58 /DNA_ID=CAMNT_0047416433 /DNA_START=540 /DNA_END=712 /DNA_ORIENTATION=+